MINKLKRYLAKKPNISFAKSGDDIQLMMLLNEKTPGTYVDVGCWHPKQASNTYFFYLRNWKGICIDPNPELIKLYKKFRPNDHFINAGIGASDESLDYFMFKESSMNTFSEDFYEKYKIHSPLIKKVKIPLVSLKEVLDKNLNENDRLDFFDVDVEGFDLEVLKTNDWKKYRPKIIIIESDIPLKEDLDSEIVHYLALQDYRLIGKSIIHDDLGNLFFISN
ncbi:MAG: FkbM family methyltransferase [Flavobacterium sp.]|jgi:FkbM family methyltransferase|nr:FkbM family methyltransferase [Flavobacterium sp.]